MKTTKKVEDAGMLAKDMNLEQLQDVAVSIKLFSKEEVSKMKRAPLLKAIHAWEDKAVEANKDKKTGLRKLSGSKTPTVATEKPVEDFYNGKKVLSRTERVINGKTYEDIKVVSGEIFTNPK